MLSVVVLLLCSCMVFGQLPPDYESKNGAEKREILWSNIIADPYTPDKLPTSYPASNITTVLNDSRVADASFLTNVFVTFSDELEKSRPKLVFPFGVALKAELKIFPDSPFTGIFKSGGLAIVRLGSNLGELLTATLAIKIFVDGRYAENILAEHDTEGSKGLVDYFGKELFTAYPVIINDKNQLVGDAFTNASFLLDGDSKDRPINNANLGLVEQSRIESNGQNVTGNITAPYTLKFVPSGKINATVDTLTQDFRTVLLKTIPSDTLLYTVHAQTEPGCDDYIPIGELWSRSTPVASKYEDQRLLFRQARRQWDPSFGLNKPCGKKGTTGIFDVQDITPAPFRSPKPDL